MRRFVLDTSIFTNPHVAAQFGEDSAEGLKTFLQLARQGPAEFYMPLSVYEEFRGMRDLEELAADDAVSALLDELTSLRPDAPSTDRDSAPPKPDPDA